MTPPKAVYHALLRPCIVQILRATGFHSARSATIDSLTEVAARYLELLCEETARHAADNNVLVRGVPGEYDWHFGHEHRVTYENGDDNAVMAVAGSGGFAPSVVDLRMALQDVGALLPEVDFEEQKYSAREDVRGMEEFVNWAKGSKFREIRRVALDGADDDAADYLSVLKQRHSKTAEDSKYTGTLLGKGDHQNLVPVEGGNGIDSIQAWMEKRRATLGQSPVPDSRPPSSGLSSVGSMAEDMDLS